MRRKLLTTLLVLGWTAAAGAQGTTWALVVGVDDYVQESVPDLRYAVADAKLFARGLQDAMKVPAQNIVLLTSDSVDEASQPRVTNLAYRLGWLKEKVKPQDTLVFYFAGHGMTIDEEPYLLTEEADNRSSLTLKVSALRARELVTELARPRAANAWVILDACRTRSGTALDGSLSSSFANDKMGAIQTAAMLSCAVGERSYEWEEKKHGCFTYFLVEGLSKQAADPSGRVTLQRLQEHVRDEVPSTVLKLGAEQHPSMFYYGPGTDRWLLATVAPPAGVAKSGGDAETSRYVAKLESLQAQLDKETALRVAAEERARLEESKRQELGQRLALLEKRLNGTPGLAQQGGQPNALAYSDRGDDGALQALQQEVQRLRSENAELKQRLGKLDAEAQKVGMVSREVRLQKEPDLERRWQQARQQEEALEAQMRASSDPQEKLRLSQQIRAQLGEQLAVYELCFKDQQGPRPSAQVAEELEFLKERVELQKRESIAHEARIGAAESALQEAEARLAESQAREQLYLAEIRNLHARTSQLEQQQKVLEEQLAQRRREYDQLRQDVDRLSEENRRLLAAQVKRHQNVVNHNPWLIRGQMLFEDLIVTPTTNEAEHF